MAAEQGPVSRCASSLQDKYVPVLFAVDVMQHHFRPSAANKPHFTAEFSPLNLKLLRFSGLRAM
jgi:hypothetical protein